MLAEYCPHGEIQKLKQELWGLTMKNSDIAAYTARFGDLVILCPGMVPTESKKIERFIWGLSPQLQGNVIVANPLIFYSARRLAQTLVDHGVRQGFMVPIPEQPKEGAAKRSYGISERGNNHKNPKKKQQKVAVHTVIVPTAVPIPVPTIVSATPTTPSRYAGTFPK